MNNKFRQSYLNIYFLTVLNFVREDDVIKNYINFLKHFLNDSDIESDIENYSLFISSLKSKGYDNLSDYTQNLITSGKINTNEENLIKKELEIISKLISISYEEIKEIFTQKYPDDKEIFSNLAYYQTRPLELKPENLSQKNSEDIYKSNRTFLFGNDLKIKPLKTDERLSFKNLKGYKEQQRVLWENTNSLIQGKKVNNILLYGDAGCGKSSSVRALLGEFEEIKIVQIKKDNLINIDKLYVELSNLPYKFIIFADDISFDENDNSLSSMKASLEGSLIACPKNAVIYATSNRRHLIKESFQSRMGDNVHLQDTLNEISSLSERFGINLLFLKPSNDEFCEIVKLLADDYNITENEEELIAKAQKYALIKGSRSPRIAKQLIDNIIANVNI